FNASFQSAGESFEESQSNTAGGIDSAFGIEFSSKYSGQIALNDDNDYYSFTLPESGRISINVTAVMANIYYHLVDKNGNLIWDSDRVCWDERSGQSQNTFEFDLVAGDYYFRVGKTYGSTGNYNFKIDYKSASESFKEDQSTFYNDISTACSVKFDTLYKGQIASNDDKDMYVFSIAESGKVTLNINAYCYRLNYILYDENGDAIWSQNDIEWDSNSKQSQRTYTLDLVSGKYYFGVLKNSTGNYDFKMTYKPANESFKENQTTKYNDIASAFEISLGKEYNGQIAINDTNDYYKFTLAEPKKVYLKFSGAMDYLFYYVYDSNGNEVYGNGYRCNDVTGKFEATDSVDLSAGTYYLLCYEAKTIYVSKWGTNVYGAKGVYTFCITDEVAKFNVTFDPKGGTVDPKTTTIKYEEEIELPTPSRSYTLSFDANGGKDAPEKKNVSAACLGWNTTDDGKAEYKCGDKFTTDENKTLFAVWADETNVTLPSETPVRDGYKFLGWSTDSNALAPEYTAGANAYINSDMTLYAVWETAVMRGDADGNGKVTAADARIALRISAKLQAGTESEISACDLNGDKKVTASEARMILRFSARLEKTL
ncbi:MAG: InlB B-repeat-containing protein, partial [Oscillospiraceae bacterium]|nr:InlB B-repeat-containing protein [Oscillospiraceae bacterium]